MSELDAIRKKKLEELQRLQQERFQQQAQEEMQVQQQIAQLEAIVRQALTKDALVRYGNIKAAHPEKAVQILVILAQAIQSGHIQKIDDNTFKEILRKITPKQRDIKIKRV